MFENVQKGLTPDKIVAQLFYFHSQAHFNHLQTTSFAAHKALDELYNGLVEFKDKIGELLLGYQAPKRFGVFQCPPITKISDVKLATDIATFADEVYEWSEKQKFYELCNHAADLNGLAQKIRYLLTLS